MKDNTLLIDGKNYDPETLTCADLRVHYGTGRSVLVSGSGRNRVTKYRTGFQTNIGDIEVSAWNDLMRTLITRLGEDALQRQLQQWLKEHCAWIHTSAEVEQEAQQLHASRIFDDPIWCDYIGFNRQYRPEILKTADLIWVKRKCCGYTHQMTREQFERMQSISGGEEYCHDCSDYTPLVLTDPPEEAGDQNG